MAMALRGMEHGPGTLVSYAVFVWRIIAFRVNVPGWSGRLMQMAAPV
jgi:hypothetical protein